VTELAYFFIILLVLLGLVLGSFLSALTYRLPRGLSLKGRSICPKCKKKISWFDNIPLFAFIILKGRCRYCQKKISLRYPLIELISASGLACLYLIIKNCPNYLQTAPSFASHNINPLLLNFFCQWVTALKFWAFPFFASIFLLLLAIFIIDLEAKIIPDSLIFSLYLFLIFALIFLNPDNLYLFFLSGFLAAAFLLIIHLATKGKGMGLGDVKFALFGGTFFGWPLTAIWLFFAFLTGAAIGVILILLGKARLKQKIAFGPFLIISILLTALFGEIISKWFFLL